MEIILGNRYLLKKQIGSGSFGEIFQGVDLQTNQSIAIKLEKIRNSSESSHQHSRQLLKDEATIYKILDGMVGVPRAFAYGTQSYYNILVIDLLDKSLEDLLKKCKGRFSLKTVLMLADQMLLCLEGMHRNFLVHRDLKPENFMVGFGPQINHNKPYIQSHTKNSLEASHEAGLDISNNNENFHLTNSSNSHFEFFQNSQKSSSQDIQENLHNRNFFFSQNRNLKQNFSIPRSNNVYIIDFGLSKIYYDAKQGAHIPLVEHPNMTGTARYASVSALHGLEQSRRDDLESLGYILIYFLKGKLPWQGLPGNNRKDKINNILNVKSGINVEDLCEGLPSEFADYLSRVKKLHFTEEPNYSQYREIFRELFIREGFIYDYKFDWLDESPIDEEKKIFNSSNGRFNSPNYYNYSNNEISSNNNSNIYYNSGGNSIIISPNNTSNNRMTVLNSGNGIFRNKIIHKNHSQMEIQNYNFLSSFDYDHQQTQIHQNHFHNQVEPDHKENQQQSRPHHQSLQELIYVPQNQQNNVIQQHTKQNIVIPQNRKRDQQHHYSDIIGKLNSSASSFLFPSFNDLNAEALKNNGKLISHNHSQTISPPSNPLPTNTDRYIPYNNNVHPMKIPLPSHRPNKSPTPSQTGSPKAKQSRSQLSIHMLYDNQK